MSQNLVIVESPAKAKTIEGYLGKDYLVVSSIGHIRDLPKSDQAIDIENGFKPTYEVSEDKKGVVQQLRKLVGKSAVVYLASDDDREGESIAWHLKEALALDDKKLRRIVFREITKKAILNAIEHPREIDMGLVYSQQARRLLDRIVGFDLSPLLWRKVKHGLSAGRVQSVAVRMIVERERAIRDFVPTAFFKVTADFTVDGSPLPAELNEQLESYEAAHELLVQCQPATYSVADVTKKPGKRSPSAPFTTSTLQQEASNKLGYSVSRTMQLAQRLYEAGKISYMRTDSVSLSREAMDNAAQAITQQYGADYLHPRVFKNKNASAQEAHEAIRPTDFRAREASDDPAEQRLYKLIWQRTLASQMADAQLERTTVTIAISTVPQQLLAKGEVIVFKGFLAAYESTADAATLKDATLLPPLNVGQVLDLTQLLARERFSRPPARFAEASLVKQLEEQGIGRPSTYAPTINTIQKRGYVEKASREGKPRDYRTITLEQGQVTAATLSEVTGADKNKLFPTDIAMVANDFLVAHFSDVTDYGFTAGVEEKLDKIAQQQYQWDEMLAEFYAQFHPKVEKTAEVEHAAAKAQRKLGTDPKTGLPVIVRLGRYGPLVQLGEGTEEEKPRYASLLPDQRIDTITLEEALERFKLPREVGQFENEVMVASIGRFGPYIRHKGAFYSLGKALDPHEVTEAEAIQVIKDKRESDAKKLLKTFDEDPDVQIKQGRWGPFIHAGKDKVRLPKDITDPKAVTWEEAQAMLAGAAEKAPKKGAKKAATKRKAKATK